MNAVLIWWLRQLKRYSRSRARIIGSSVSRSCSCSRSVSGSARLSPPATATTYNSLRRASSRWASCSWRSSAGSRSSGTGSSAFSRKRWSRRVAAGDRARADTRRRDGRADSGEHRLSRCLVAGFRPAQPLLLPLALLFMMLIAIMCTAIGTASVGVAGHAGLSADHELHRAAALLLLKRAVPRA